MRQATRKAYSVCDDKLIELAERRAERQKKIRRERMIGVPWGFLVDVCQRVRDWSSLAVAFYVFRRTCVCRSMTVTLPSRDLAELGIDRAQKKRAMARLERVGLIRISKTGHGRTSEVTLLWRSKP